MAIPHTFLPNTNRRHCPAILCVPGNTPTTGTCNTIWDEYIWNNGGPSWIDKSQGQRLGLWIPRFNLRELLVNQGASWNSNPNHNNWNWQAFDRILDCKCFTDDEDAIVIVRFHYTKGLPFFLGNSTYSFIATNDDWLPAWWRTATKEKFEEFWSAFHTRYGNDTRVYGVGYTEGPGNAASPEPSDWPGFDNHAREYAKTIAEYANQAQPNWTHYIFQPNRLKINEGIVASGNTGSLTDIAVAHADPKLFTGDCGTNGGIGGSSQTVDCGSGSRYAQHVELQQNTGVLANPEEDKRACMMSAETNGVRNGFTVPSTWPGGDPFGWNQGQFFSATTNSDYMKHHVWYHSADGPIPCQIINMDHGGPDFDGQYNRSASDWKAAFDQLGAGGTGVAIPSMDGFVVDPGDGNGDVLQGQVAVTLEGFYSDISGQTEPGEQQGGDPVELIIDDSDGGPNYVETGTFSNVGATGEITFQNSTSVKTQGGMSHVIDKPENTAEGDELLLAVSANLSNTISISGWTQIAELAYENSVTLAAFRKTAGASEPTTYTYTTSQSVHTVGHISRVTGVDDTTAIDVTTTTDSGGNTTSPTFPAITPVTDNALVFRIVAQDKDGIQISGGHPAGHTGVYADRSHPTAALATGLAVSYIVKTPPGEVPSIDYTSNDSEQFVAFSIALRPSSVAGGGYLGTARQATAGSGTKKATYTFSNIPKTASYQIYARWPNGVSGVATNAPYTQSGRIGQGKLRYNQSINTDQWNLIFSYNIPIESTGPIIVEVDDDANGIILADGVRLIYRPLIGFIGVANPTLEDFTSSITASNLKAEPIAVTLDDFVSQGIGQTRGIVFPTPEEEQFPSGYSGRIISTVSFHVEADEDEFQKFKVTSKDVEFIIDRVSKGKFGKK